MRMDVLERLLNEGQAVDNEVNAVLKKAGVSDIDGLRNRIYQLRWVKNSPNNKDAVPTVKWIVDFAKEKGLSIEERWRDLFKWVWAIIRKKNRLNTTKNRALVDIWKEYPTFQEFEEYIDDEEQKLVNGWKDDFGGQAEVVDDDPDEVRMQRIRQDLGKPTFSTPGVVDIYRADTQAEAIRLGKGYSWCISYTTGDNYFYHYRLNPESTAYFCFFMEEQPEYEDVACVIHVLQNSRYRMTNADNDNGSPIVDEERVVYCYPPLEKWLPKMTVTPIAGKEAKFADLKKELGNNRWVNLTLDLVKDYNFNRSDWRMILSMGSGLSDELFDYLLKKYDHGKFNDKDSLINLYAKVTIYPLTAHQREVVSKNNSLIKFYDERHDGKVEEVAKQHMENLIKLGVYDKTTHTLDNDRDFVFIADVPEYPVDDNVDELVISTICQSLDGVPSAYHAVLSNNKYIKDLTGLMGVTVEIDSCAGLNHGEVMCGSGLDIANCNNLKHLVVQPFDSGWVCTIKIRECNSLQSIEGLGDFESDEDELPEIIFEDLPNLVSVPRLPYELSALKIEECPKLDIIQPLRYVSRINSFDVFIYSYELLSKVLELLQNRIEVNYLCIDYRGSDNHKEAYKLAANFRENNKTVEVDFFDLSAHSLPHWASAVDYSESLHPLRRALNNLMD